ncbi:carbohydrate kinase family protein [Ferrimonas balearica]|nr:carbohydrate kinase family protein [Ferrimonas balearica]
MTDRPALPMPAARRTGAIAPIAIVGSFSIDSVVAPDDTALPAKPGGNALWSAMGAHLAGQTPRIVARVGRDYPAAVLERLAGAGFDLGSLIRLERTHPVRVSYAHRPNGDRVQPVPEALLAHLSPEDRAEFVDTTHSPETLVEGAPEPQDIPADWLAEVSHWHLPLLPLARHRALVAALASAPGQVQADCPTRAALVGAPFERLAASLPAIDVFLPSTSDLDVFAPDLDPRGALQALRAQGARSVVLKAGADGVYVLEGRRLTHMPAWPATPIDPTGAGDAFCGGFLVARAQGADLVAAAALGSACASFALETADPLDLLEGGRAEVLRRMDSLMQEATMLTAVFPETAGAAVMLEKDPTA